MLVYQTDNYKITQNSVGPFFDVEEKCKVNAGKENEREEWKVIAYGLPFRDLLFTIALKHITSNDKTYNSLSEFLSDLESEINKVKEEFHD